jgi:crossover junction endodeoxyribonuclease RuvC
MWPLFLASKGSYVEEVVPTVWKKAMGLAGKDKEAARLKACGLFPHAGLSLKKDHNRAEALLLADYLRRRSNER